MIHSHPSIYLSTYLSLYPGRERAPAVRHAAPWPPARRGRRTQRHPPRPAGGAQSRHERSNVAALLTTPRATTRTSLQHVWRVQHVRSGVPLRHQLGGRRPAVACAQPRLGMQRRGTVGTCRFGNGQGELHEGEEQIAPKALVQASQSRSSTSSEGDFFPGAGPCVELHQQGASRLQQTSCWSPAEVAPEGAQRIDEGPAAASPSPCSSISLVPHLPGFGTDPSELHLIFAKLFTPKHPSKLPRSRWVSCN